MYKEFNMSTIKLAQCIQSTHLRNKTASPLSRLLGRKIPASTLSPGMRKALLLSGGAAGLGAGAVAGSNALVRELAEEYMKKIPAVTPTSVVTDIGDSIGGVLHQANEHIGDFVGYAAPKVISAKNSLDDTLAHIVNNYMPTVDDLRTGLGAARRMGWGIAADLGMPYARGIHRSLHNAN
jgi:hypothetical protein